MRLNFLVSLFHVVNNLLTVHKNKEYIYNNVIILVSNEDILNKFAINQLMINDYYITM